MKTLQELCLEQIVHVFDKHILAYSTSTKLKSSYEVLRRKFSLQILQKLMEEYSEIKKEYVDFLINKYLKTLDTDWLDNCSWDVIEKKFPEIGPNLETLLLCEYCNSNWEHVFSYLPNLKVVKFHRCDVEPSHCDEDDISKSNNVLKRLCDNEKEFIPCPFLREINLNSSIYIHEKDVMHLIKNLPLLEKLDYNGLAKILYSMHKEELYNLSKIKPYNFTELYIMFEHESYEDILKICLSLCPQLKTLFCPVKIQKHLNVCLEFSGNSLQHFSVADYTHNSPAVVELNDFLKVKGSILLSVNVFKLLLSVAQLAQDCPSLETLQLSRMTFVSNDHDNVPMLCNLKSLTFEDMYMNYENKSTTEAVVSLLASSPNLERLVFKNCDVHSFAIKNGVLKLCEHGKLRHVSFADSAVKFKFLHGILLSCYSLESLNLESSKVEMDFVEVGRSKELSARLERIKELEAIAFTLPNRPEVLYYDYLRFRLSDYEERDSPGSAVSI